MLHYYYYGYFTEAKFLLPALMAHTSATTGACSLGASAPCMTYSSHGNVIQSPVDEYR